MTKAEESERYPLTATFRWAHRLRDELRQPWRGAAWLDIRAAGATAEGVRATLTVRIADASALLGAAQSGAAQSRSPQRYAAAVIDCELRRDGRALVAGSPGLPAGRVRCHYDIDSDGDGSAAAGAVVDAVAIVGDLLPLRAVAADPDAR